MSDEDALLAAIAAHPEEDTPRLAYADWLDEHGLHTRAEFIRLQIDIARKQETLPRRLLDRHVDLFKRQQELLDYHRAELLGPLAGLPADAKVEFRRGFVSEVEFSVDDFLTHAHLLACAVPRPAIAVDRVTARLDEFFHSAHLDCITRVRAFSPSVETQPRIWPGQYFLVAKTRFTALQVLDVEGCRLGDVALSLFLFAGGIAPVLPDLVDLDLSNNLTTDAGVARLLDSMLPLQLKRLILGGNPIGDAGAIALAERWPTGEADKLEHLNLRFTNIGQPGQQALLARFGGRVDLF